MVAILDSFHFKVTEEHQDSEPPAEQQEEEENDEDEKTENETSASSLPQRIHSTILNTILPGLESCLTKEVLLTSLFRRILFDFRLPFQIILDDVIT